MSERQQKWLALLIGSILGIILGHFLIKAMPTCAFGNSCKPQGAECDARAEVDECCEGFECVMYSDVCGNGTCEPIPPKLEIRPQPPATPSATPTPVPHVPGPDTSGPPGEYHSRKAYGEPQSEPICIDGHFTGPNSAWLGWHKHKEPDKLRKLSLKYGYSPDNLEFGIDSIPPDSLGLEVHGVDTSGHIYFKVIAEDYKFSTSESEICDP